MESKACVASCSAEDGTAKVRVCFLVVFVAYLEDVSSYTILLLSFPLVLLRLPGATGIHKTYTCQVMCRVEVKIRLSSPAFRRRVTEYRSDVWL
jgi:hypothetical protein